MSKLLSNDFKKKVKGQLDKIDFFRKLITEEEIENIKPIFEKFTMDPKNDESVFNDGSRNWIVLQSPEKNDFTKPTPSKSEFSTDQHLWICKFHLGTISVFGTLDLFRLVHYDSVAIITGKVTVKYRSFNKGYFKTLEELAKDIGVDILELTENHFKIAYSINIYQVIERLED